MNIYEYLYILCMKNFICLQKFMESQSDIIRINVKFISLSKQIFILCIYLLCTDFGFNNKVCNRVKTFTFAINTCNDLFYKALFAAERR